ncbi:hypothetical protein AAF712_013974 [Marasmius tenuissimus]|uniref:Uncharacterized protein n=1 Tax=Marasmius tenuissimus TaxID=585030 RepID=A0ABR2ZCB1_9AGAR
MFAKGRRFNPQKVSDVPPPGSYNPEEAQFDDYKKGVILEKADRFCKEADSEIPGPSAYGEKMLSMKGSGKATPGPASSDRYAVLQRKLEELERIHNEGKRTHQVEVERLKMELARSQKTNADLTERLGKQTKQGAAYEHKLEEMKRAAGLDKAEIKDLATKLRISENQRAQVTAKQDDVIELKKNLHASEAKRKEEMRERDRKIAELEKNVASEKKGRNSAEEQLKKKDAEISGLGDSVQMLKTEIMQARDEIEDWQTRAQDSQVARMSKEAFLLQDLENCRTMLERATHAYGALSAGAISKANYEELRHKHYALQIQHARVQRKLANSESQVSELAHLVRQTKEDHRLLQTCLQDAEDVILHCSNNSTSQKEFEQSYASLKPSLDIVHEQLIEAVNLNLAAKLDAAQKETTLLYLGRRNALDLASDQQIQLQEADLAQDSLSAELKEAQKRRNMAEELLKSTTDTVTELQVSLEIYKRQVCELVAKVEEERRQSKAIIGKEKENTQRLSLLVQKGKMAEDGLRAEIDQLTTELIEAERFQEAYYCLRDHLETLSAQNELAEEEVEKLSAFNAEIIGHHNPAQRILYVERIRNELAETKHKLIASTKTHEAVVALNEDLRQELDMYKSVISDNRPKTTLTRVARPPLVDLNQSQPRERTVTGSELAKSSIIAGDMTLDEIL